MVLKVLIPVRGIFLSKKNLRKKFENSLVSRIVEKLLENTIQQILDINLIPIILTSEKKLIKELEDRNIQCLYDDGKSLNQAIKKAVSFFKNEELMLVMADLPGLNNKNLSKFIKLREIYSNIIVPSHDAGTSIALVPDEILSAGLFGKNSSLKIINQANKLGSKLCILHTHNLSRDLDNEADWKYWQNSFED